MVAAITLSLAGSLAACSSPPPDLTEGRAGNEARPSVLVSMGAIETSNLDFRTDRRDTWTQLVFTHAMPAASVFVDLAGDNITAERVIETQLPELASLHPDVVTIWVEAADVRLATPPSTYQRELTELIAGARQAGARKVLLMTPPASEANLSGGYAGSVAAVASRTGATLVNLDDTSDRYSDDGQRHIADSVIAALR
jgi:GDSL-like Lipase/Acylhydrolase family